ARERLPPRRLELPRAGQAGRHDHRRGRGARSAAGQADHEAAYDDHEPGGDSRARGRGARLAGSSLMALVTFPDGTRVRASPISERQAHDPERAFGLYLDKQWDPTWAACVIDWPDFGLPEDPEAAAGDIAAAFDRARNGELVEVGCLGGRGRTGTALACMAVLAGVPG